MGVVKAVTGGQAIDNSMREARVRDRYGMISRKPLHGIFHFRMERGASGTLTELCLGGIAIVGESLASGTNNEGEDA